MHFPFRRSYPVLQYVQISASLQKSQFYIPHSRHTPSKSLYPGLHSAQPVLLAHTAQFARMLVFVEFVQLVCPAA